MSKITTSPKSIFHIINLETGDHKSVRVIEPTSSKRDSAELKPSKYGTNLIFEFKEQSVEKKDSRLQSATLSTLRDINSQRNELRFQETANKGNKNYNRPAAKKSSSILSDFHTPKSENSEEFKFKFTVFLEVMVYQIIFFFLLGPFIHILLFLPFTNKHVLRNIQFIGVPCLVQSIQWALLMVIIVLYIFDSVTNKQIKDIYVIELYDPSLITFSRTLVAWMSKSSNLSFDLKLIYLRSISDSCDTTLMT